MRALHIETNSSAGEGRNGGEEGRKGGGKEGRRGGGEEGRNREENVEESDQ